MPSCYSCRKNFEPSALKVSYSKNYCEGCGVGLFGGDYYGFSEKPDPTVQKTIAVYLKVIFFLITGLWLLVFLFWLAKGTVKLIARARSRLIPDKSRHSDAP